MMGGPEGQNPQSIQQQQQQQPQQQGPPQQAMNQVFTQGQGGPMPPSGYRPQQSIAPMRMSKELFFLRNTLKIFKFSVY